MLNIVKSDTYRVVKSIVIFIGVIVLILMNIISVYIIQPGSIGPVFSVAESSEYDNKYEGEVTEKMITGNLTTAEAREILLKDEDYELDRAIMSNNFNLFYIFIIVAALAISTDFSSGAAKNSLSSAISRKKYFVAKLIFVLTGCTVIFLVNNYLMYFINYILNSGKVSGTLATITMLSLRQIPAILALAVFLTGLAFILRKSSLFSTITVAIAFCYPLLLTLIRKLFPTIKLSNLLRFEFGNILKQLALAPSDNFYITSYIFSAAVAIVFITLGWLSFRKSEIK